MNALRKLSGSGSSSRSSGSAAPTQYVVTVSRAGGSFGLGLSDDNVVTTVAEKSSAAEASIQPNDRVVTVDGQPVGSRKLVSLLAENRNTEITLGIERGSSSVARKSSGSGATPRGLGLFSSRSKSNTQTDDVHRTGSFADMGERILTLRLARESDGDAMGLEVDQTNKVTAVMADTVAHKAGLQVGDVVTKLDGKDLQGASLTDMQDENFDRRVLMLTIRRGVPIGEAISHTPRRHSAEI